MSAEEIDRYVYDRWSWKEVHANSVALYAASARG